MNKISVVIITYNEEKNIERCLKSVQKVADEILVVDSFSVDQTEEICKRFNTRFIQHSFEGYVAQKNWAMKEAKYDYVLSLDADEELTDKLVQSILKIKENWTHDGYSFKRLNNYCGHWMRFGSNYNDIKLRLWDRRKGQWSGRKVHEKIRLMDNYTTAILKGYLRHYSYNSIQQHFDRSKKYAELSALEFIDSKKKIYFLYLAFNPFYKFIRDYFFRLGFLDGYYGLVVCWINSYFTYYKYVKSIEIKKKSVS